MIEETGVITRVEAQYIVVTTQVKTTCGSCVAQDNCGTGTIARAFADKQQELRFPCEQHVEVGQQVKLGIPEQALLNASVLMYMLPMITLVASALFAQWLMAQVGIPGEGGVIAISALATVASFMWVRHQARNTRPQFFEPQLLSIVSPSAKQVPIKTL